MTASAPDAAIAAPPEGAAPQSDRPAVDPLSAASGLGDLRCHVNALIGTGRISVRECLRLAPGRLLVLHQTAGEDLQLLANGVLVAAGEVVVDEDHTMIRVTEVAPLPGLEQ